MLDFNIKFPNRFSQAFPPSLHAKSKEKAAQIVKVFIYSVAVSYFHSVKRRKRGDPQQLIKQNLNYSPFKGVSLLPTVHCDVQIYHCQVSARFEKHLFEWQSTFSLLKGKLASQLHSQCSGLPQICRTYMARHILQPTLPISNMEHNC